MTSFSIAGLSSGIDTTSLISQLMTVAAAPQNALQGQLSQVQKQLSAYQDINTKMAAVKSAADALAIARTWQATTAASSDASIVASGSSTALAGTSTTMSVTQLAQAQVSTAALADPANAANAAAGLDLTIGVSTTHLNLAGNAATDVVSAINAAGLGIRASLITTSTGSVLQLASTSTGQANSFSISGLSAPVQSLRPAQDATITVGDPANGGYSVTSSSNTFADAIPGVSFTVSKLTTDATLSISSDTTSISNAVAALVNATNTALKTISADTAQGGVLTGDTTLNALTEKLLGVVSAGAGGKSFATAGVDITSTGTLTFNADSFAAAFAANPALVQSQLQTSLSAGFSSVGDGATNGASGSLTQVITSDNSQISSLNKRITNWTSKLAGQKLSLQTKYAAMEAALSKLKSQSS